MVTRRVAATLSDKRDNPLVIIARGLFVCSQWLTNRCMYQVTTYALSVRYPTRQHSHHNSCRLIATLSDFYACPGTTLCMRYLSPYAWQFAMRIGILPGHTTYPRSNYFDCAVDQRICRYESVDY